jgi:hypothetical protein
LDEIKRFLRIAGVASDQAENWIAVPAHDFGKRVLLAREA